jgi:hypothetical protein
MIRARFGDFWHDQRISAAAVLYALYEGTQCLYVGISRWDVWRRWFDRSRGHIRGRGSNFCTRVGAYVVDNLPRSLEWEIELWTLEECQDALRGEDKVRHLTLTRCEDLMIGRKKPIFNITNNPHSCEEIAGVNDAEISAFYDSVRE